MAEPKTETYRTLAGEDIVYPTPSRDLAAFLARVRDAVNNLSQVVVLSSGPLIT